MKPDKYVLVGKVPKLEPDIISWMEWRHGADCTINMTQVGEMCVLTVFLGIDHAFDGGPPLLFETMIFARHGEIDAYQGRCTTWEQAEIQHANAVEAARASTTRTRKERPDDEPQNRILGAHYVGRR